MAHTKLDMGKAWTQATALIGANKDTVGALAGLFFFLPALAAALFIPEATAIVPAGGNQDPQMAMQEAVDQMTALYADNWPVLLAVSIAGFVGSLSLLALLTDRGNPTVGEALGTGMRSVLSYIAAQLLSAVAAGMAVGLPLGLLAAFAPPAMVAVAMLALIVVAIYMLVKFSLIAPVIAIDGVRNPVTAITRSWQLTKGNSLRVFAFFMLLFVTVVIIGALVQGILTLVLSAIGGTIASVGTAIVSAGVNTVMSVILLIVLAAIHRQLGGAAPERLAEAFE